MQPGLLGEKTAVGKPIESRYHLASSMRFVRISCETHAAFSLSLFSSLAQETFLVGTNSFFAREPLSHAHKIFSLPKINMLTSACSAKSLKRSASGLKRNYKLAKTETENYKILSSPVGGPAKWQL